VKVMKADDIKKFSSEKMQKCGLFETDHLFCDLYCFEPGQTQKVHTHDNSEKVYYVLEGKGTFTIGDESRELSMGETTIAPKGAVHGVENTSDARLVVLTIMTPRP